MSRNRPNLLTGVFVKSSDDPAAVLYLAIKLKPCPANHILFHQLDFMVHHPRRCRSSRFIQGHPLLNAKLLCSGLLQISPGLCDIRPRFLRSLPLRFLLTRHLSPTRYLPILRFSPQCHSIFICLRPSQWHWRTHRLLSF